MVSEKEFANVFRMLAMAAVASAMAMLAACNSGDEFAGLPGKYSGIVTFEGSAQGVSSQSENAQATVALVPGNDHEITVQVSEAASAKLTWSLDAKWDGSSTIVLAGALSSGDSLNLKRGDDGCFTEDGGTAAGAAKLCASGGELTFENRAGTDGLQKLMLWKDDPNTAVKLETPASYTLDQLLERVKNGNYSSRIALEQYVQAKLNAQEQLLNLIPHFNVTDLLNVLSLNEVTIAKSVGDFAPFLFPQKWLEADAAGWQKQAQEQAWRAAEADAAEIVEGLAYSVARDQATLLQLANHREDVSKIRDLIVQRENSGLMQLGSHQEIDGVLESIDEAAVLLEQSLSGEYAALAQAVGFINPKAISSIEGVPETLPATPIPDLDGMIPVVIKTSPEFAQADDLVQSADLEKDGSYFAWMDPSGNALGIGFGMGDEIKIAQSNVQLMALERDDLKTTLSQKTSDAIDQYSQVLTSYQNGLEAQSTEQQVVDQQTKNLTNGLVFSLSDLKDALEARTQGALQAISSQYNAWAAVARLERLAGTGIFHDIETAAPDSQSADPSPTPSNSD